MRIHKQAVRELCLLSLEIKRLQSRYNQLSAQLKKELSKIPGDSVNKEIEVGEYKILYSRKPRKTYSKELIEKLPKNLVKQIVRINTSKVEELLRTTSLTPKQYRCILNAIKFDGVVERIYPKIVERKNAQV